MLKHNPDAVHFLRTRRSRPAKTLTLPVPDDETLRDLLTIGARVPDHGKLEPFRFIVLKQDALRRLGGIARMRGTALGLPDDKIDKGAHQFETGNLAVAIVEVQKPSEKVPAIEQTYSAGAVCLSLLNAALASGWGANWLSGWPSHDPEFLGQGLELAGGERVAGLIHIGTETNAPPERPRPDISAITTWVTS